MALAAGVDRAVIEAINAGKQPKFPAGADEMVHAARVNCSRPDR
jgi:hypothetical protein